MNTDDTTLTYCLHSIDCGDCSGCGETGCLEEEIASDLAKRISEAFDHSLEHWSCELPTTTWRADYFTPEDAESFIETLGFEIKLLEPWGDEPDEDDKIELTEEGWQQIYKSTARNLNHWLWTDHFDEDDFKAYVRAHTRESSDERIKKAQQLWEERDKIMKAQREAFELFDLLTKQINALDATIDKHRKTIPSY
jgi:hypothetical protein